MNTDRLGKRWRRSTNGRRGIRYQGAALAARQSIRWNKCHLLVIYGCALLGLTASDPTFAQRRGAGRVQPRVIQANIRRPTRPLQAISIEPTAPIANLLSRAKDGADRHDWKFTIDCLQRVIDNPQDSLLVQQDSESEGIELYESARRAAVRALAALPPEALRSYRLLFDGRAKRLFQKGTGDHDSDSLRKLVSRYILTSYGTSAVDLLISWALDEGRFDEVVVLANELSQVEGAPQARIQAKLAAAHALLGRDGASKAILKTLRDAGERGMEKPTPPSLIEGIGRLSESALTAEAIPPAWPIAGGNPARRGVMAGVTPTISEMVPWSFRLPGAGADTWRPAADYISKGALSLPIGRLVTDGELLLARTRHGCVALHPDDLDVVWEAINSPRRVRSTTQGPSAGGEQGPPTTDAGLALTDRVAGGIAIGHGMAMIVTREGLGSYTQGERDVTKRGLLSWIPRPILTTQPVRGSRLVAYDIETGDAVWQRGRTRSHDDPLGDADFLSVPLAVHDALWVPYLRHDTLHVAVLDPEDGALRRSIRILSADPGPGVALDGIQLAAGDGMVFVPTDRNALFAVDAYDLSVRWAVRYDSSLTDTASEEDEQPGGWHSGPPVVVAGMVLIAPRARNELLAFSILDGRLLWKTFCTDVAHIIAADRERVWLGGQSVSCVSVSDGKFLWTREVESLVTGHAVKSRERILVPTLNGLVSINGQTGDVLDETPAPMGHGAIGNVLCFGTSMYSINPFSVRRFPDIELSYARAQAESAEDPENAAAAIKLAWLKLLRGDPAAAFDTVDAIPATSTGRLENGAGRNADKIAQDLAHVRVEALLAMVARADASTGREEQILSLLEDAELAARTPKDRLRCTLAIADQLLTLERGDEAFDRLWQLGLSRDGAQTAPLIRHVVGTARSAVAMRLSKLEERLGAGVLSGFHDKARSTLGLSPDHYGEIALTPDKRERLQAVAELGVPGSLARRALLELGLFYAGQHSFEPAEQLLLEALRGAPDTDLELAARMGLCRLYATCAASGFSPQDVLVSELNRLEQLFGGDTIPPAMRSGTEPGSMSAESSTVSDWIRSVRSQQPELEFPKSSETGSSADAQFTDEIVWSINPIARGGDAARVIDFSTAQGACSPDDIVVHSPGDIITSYRADDGTILWQTRLRLPGEFDDRVFIKWRPEEDGTRHAVVDGQTMVLNGRYGLFAVGRTTGRRLWYRAHEPKGGSIAPPEADTAMAAENGLLAAMPHAGRLVLMRLRDGSTVWDRDLLGESIEYLWMGGDHVISADSRMQRVHVFAKSDGRMLSRILFDQPDPYDRLIDLIRTEDTICGPVADSDGKGIAAIDLTTATPTWRVQFDKPLMHLFRPQDGYLGVSLLGGDVRIVDIMTGEEVLERRISGAHSISRGVLIDGTLLVQPNTTQGGVRTSSLIALDVATDTELWRRDGVVPLWRMDRPLHIIDGHLPVLIQAGRHNARQDRGIALAMLDIRTGLGNETNVKLPTTRGSAQLNGDFEWMDRSGVAVIGTDTGIRVLRIVSNSAHQQEGL